VQGTGNREQGATGSRYQGTGIREQVSGNREQGTGSRDQGTRSCRPGSEFEPGFDSLLVFARNEVTWQSELYFYENNQIEIQYVDIRCK